MTISRTEYEKHQDEIIMQLFTYKAQGKRLIADDVVEGLDPAQDNSHVRDWAKKELSISREYFDTAMRKHSRR